MINHNRRIRSITIGKEPLHKESLRVQVGSRAGGIKSEYRVSSILEDNSQFLIFGIKVYNVFIKKGDGEEYSWKSFEGVPVTKEYFFPGDDEEIVDI